jgi:hypothetical protein
MLLSEQKEMLPLIEQRVQKLRELVQELMLMVLLKLELV